jgi:hypothetical protein
MNSSQVQTMRWQMNIYQINDNGIIAPLLIWKCFIGERMEIGSIKATPRLGLIFTSEFNDTAFQIGNFEQAEAILSKFGLKKPPLIEKVLNDLLVLDNQYMGDIDYVKAEYEKLALKWWGYTPKTLN